VHRNVQELIAAARARVREVGPHELLAVQQRGAAVVDVREPDEFDDGHIPGAINVPRCLLEFEVDGHPAIIGPARDSLLHRTRPLVLYCLSGGRSVLAAEALVRLGFAAPVSLAGGLLHWADAGHPVARPAR